MWLGDLLFRITDGIMKVNFQIQSLEEMMIEVRDKPELQQLNILETDLNSFVEIYEYFDTQSLELLEWSGRNTSNKNYKHITAGIKSFQLWLEQWRSGMNKIVFSSEIHLLYLFFRDPLSGKLFLSPFADNKGMNKPLKKFLSVFTKDMIAVIMMVRTG